MLSNALLKKEVLDLYDYIKLKNIIITFFKIFNLLKIKNDKIPIPTISSKNVVIYKDFTWPTKTTLDNCSLKYLLVKTENEEQRKMLFSKFTLALRKLNPTELEVFNLIFYKGIKEDDVVEMVNYGKDKVREIKKSACLKIVSALGLDNKCFK